MFADALHRLLLCWAALAALAVALAIVIGVFLTRKDGQAWLPGRLPDVSLTVYSAAIVHVGPVHGFPGMRQPSRAQARVMCPCYTMAVYVCGWLGRGFSQDQRASARGHEARSVRSLKPDASARTSGRSGDHEAAAASD